MEYKVIDLYYPVYFIALTAVFINEYYVSDPARYRSTSFSHFIQSDSLKFLLSIAFGAALPALLRELWVNDWAEVYKERCIAIFLCGIINIAVLCSPNSQELSLFWVLIGKFQFFSLIAVASKRACLLNVDEFGIISFILLFLSEIANSFTYVPLEHVKSLRIFSLAVESINFARQLYLVVRRQACESKFALGISDVSHSTTVEWLRETCNAALNLDCIKQRDLRLLSAKSSTIIFPSIACVFCDCYRWEDYGFWVLVCMHLSYYYNMIVILLNVVGMSADLQWRLKTNLEIKKNIIRHLSHQVRNPLNVIVGGLDILKTELDYILQAPENHELQKLMTELCTSCDVAVNVMDDLVYFEDETIVADNLDTRVVVAVNVVVDTAVRWVRRFAREKGLTINILYGPKDAFVLVNSKLIQQALRNLILNAVKFSNQNGVVVLKVMLEGDNVSIKIIDFGSGIAADKLMEISAVLEGGASALPKTGSYVNIVVARSIINRHNGKVSFVSQGIDSGAVITIALPLVLENSDSMVTSAIASMKATVEKAKATAAKALSGEYVSVTDVSAVVPSERKFLTRSRSGSFNIPPSVRATASASSSSASTDSVEDIIDPLRVLIVDDVTSCRKVLNKMLTRKGHICTEVDDGDTCVELMGTDPYADQYDVILIDNSMVRMNGPEACKKLRDVGFTLPIIGITGNALQEDMIDFVNKGANSVLRKPANLDTIMLAIKEAEQSKILRSIGSADSDFSSASEHGSTPPDSSLISMAPLSLHIDTSHEDAMRILIVDDVSSSRKVVNRILTSMGHICTEAEDGDVCLELMGDDPNNPKYDAIMLDNLMPRLTGRAVARILLERGFSNIPIIGVTGETCEADLQEFRESGVQVVLTKPVLPDEVMGALLGVTSRTASIASQDVSSPRPLNVLIVDDSGSARKIVKKALHRQGHLCVEADDGDTCLQMLQHPAMGGFDVVILDNMMSRVDGPSCASYIKEHKLPIAVIGLTSYCSDTEKKFFLQSGADIVLQKPAQPDQLNEALRSIKSRSQPTTPSPIE